jgi:hypothetical protein
LNQQRDHPKNESVAAKFQGPGINAPAYNRGGIVEGPLDKNAKEKAGLSRSYRSGEFDEAHGLCL